MCLFRNCKDFTVIRLDLSLTPPISKLLSKFLYPTNFKMFKVCGPLSKCFRFLRDKI